MGVNRQRQAAHRMGSDPIRMGSDPNRMARRNTRKQFKEHSFYHLYNRGVEGRDIFLDPEDYGVFLATLTRYLAPLEVESRPGFKPDKPSLHSYKQKMNLHDQVTLLAYCLMPNHFHLLVKQNIDRGITALIHRVCVNYSMYFNTKYERRGGLFESVYKAVLVESESQLLHLSRYIHLNPVNLKTTRFGPVATTATARPGDYEYSSYSKYLNRTQLPWFNPHPVLDLFGKGDNRYTSYQGFVEDYRLDSTGLLGPLVIEGEWGKIKP